MRKRLLAILSRYLWPIDSGRKESLTHYFKELYDNFNYEIKILCFVEPGQEVREEDKPYYIAEVNKLCDASSWRKLINIASHSILPPRWPFQCSLYYCKKSFKQIRACAQEYKPDVIFTEMIRTCMYYKAFKGSNARLIANLDDLLSVRYLRQLGYKQSQAGLAGNYEKKLSEGVSKALNSSFLKRLVLKMESRRCAIWERRFYKIYDDVLMTADKERDALNQEMQGNKAKTLSVGIDYGYFSQDLHVEKDPIGLSFVGNFNVAANIDSLSIIVNNLLPEIKHEHRLYVIGPCPQELQDKYSVNDKIIFCGRVDDLREYVKRTEIFLSPIAYGTGIKTKIVEAMAMGVPVLTNSIGIEGISAEFGEDVIVSDDMKELASWVDKLLSDPECAARIGKAGQKFSYDHFRWEKVFEVYRKMGL